MIPGMNSLSIDVAAAACAERLQQREMASPPPIPPRPQQLPAQQPSTSQEVPRVDHTQMRYTPTTLGQGTFGKVIKASYGLHGYVAVKIMDNKGKESTMRREIIRLHKYGGGSEHIVRFYGYTEDPLGYAMEFMDCGSLDDLLNKNKKLQYRIDHVLSWLRQVGRGAAYMHDCGLVHRDFKPHNLLLRDRYLTIKIGDFGEVGEVKQTMTNCKGSAPWMAPEVFKSKQYSTACDVYSLGVILWQMMSRKHPYPGISAYTILWNTAQGARPMKMDCHPMLWTMIERMWSMEPAERPTMEMVVEFTSILMRVYNRYNEPLIDSRVEARQQNSLFGGNRLTAGRAQVPPKKSHRRGGSYDTALINSGTAGPSSGTPSGLATPVAEQQAATRIEQASDPMRAVRSQSFAHPQGRTPGRPVPDTPDRSMESSSMGSGYQNHASGSGSQSGFGAGTPSGPSGSQRREEDAVSELEEHLRPIQPIYGDAESEEKFNCHVAWAWSLKFTKSDVDNLTKEKHRLISNISDSMEIGKLLKRKAFLEKTILDCYTKVENGKGKARTPTTPSSPRME